MKLPPGIAAVCVDGEGSRWQPVDGVHVVKQSTAHLFRFSLPVVPEQCVCELAALLDRDEQARATRFRFDRDRRQFSICRGLLRVMLGEYLQRDPKQIHFEYGPFGKPAISGGPRFNLSHSGTVALLAIGGDREIGVDVERTVGEFHDAEVDRAAFSRNWTQREAAVKALGLGLGAAESADAWQTIRQRVELREVNMGPGFEDYAAAIGTVLRASPPISPGMHTRRVDAAREQRLRTKYKTE